VQTYDIFGAELLKMRELVLVLTVTTLLAGCGYLALRDNPDATFGGVTPALTVPDGVDPDSTSVDEVADIANPAIKALSENAPENPADTAGWIAAVAVALGAAGTAAAKKYLKKKK
jgi:hypothetical protein